MLLILHIILAVSSLLATAVLYVMPLKRLLMASYVSIILTLLSGASLVLFQHASLASSCVSGLVYLVVVIAGLIPAQSRILQIPSR